MALYRAVLGASAEALLRFDLSFQEHVDRGFADNAGWLDVTHGVTFANAVRQQCTKFPSLWPQGLLQVALQCGRNAGFRDARIEDARWQVMDPEAFFGAEIARLFDHGREEFIVSVHLLKTLLAAREEVISGAAGEAASLVLAGVNRFLHSPAKRKHVRRTARQALDFVALDG